MEYRRYIRLTRGITLTLLLSANAFGGERFEVQDVAAASQRVLQCLRSPGQWKAEVTNRIIVDFSTAYSDTNLPNVCLQYVSCTDRAKNEKFSQLLECAMTPNGCEELQHCAEARAAGDRPFFLADIRATDGPSSYTSPDTTVCTQAGNPEALHVAQDRAVCIQKMDCGKPNAPQRRLVFACPVTGQAFRPDRIEDGAIQQCPSFHDCVRRSMRFNTFEADTPTKTVNVAPARKAVPSEPATPSPKTASKSASKKPTKRLAAAPKKTTVVRKPATKPKPSSTAKPTAGKRSKATSRP